MASLISMDLDQQQRNFFCLTVLLYDVGNKTLREYFKKQWPIVYLKAKPGTPPPGPTWTDVPNDAVEMLNIEKKLKLKPNEQAKFDKGDTNKWDFSLLSSVLLHSSLGFINVISSPASSSPSSPPSSPEKDALEDLKDVRNDLVGHSASSRIEEAAFKAAWTKTCNALKLFGATQVDFTSVEDVLKKPSEILVQILKKCVSTEEDIRDKISELIQKIEDNHKEIKDDIKQGVDDLKAFVKEEGQSTRSLIKKQNECEPRCILMKEDHQLLLRQRLPNFQDDVIATDLFDNLPCLTDEQKDAIAYDGKNYLHSKGVRTLVEKLEEHEEGFEQFVHALHKADLGYVAVLLDADFQDHECNEKSNSTDDEEAKYYTEVGTAVDVLIPMRILGEKQARQMDSKEKIASKYNSSSSCDSKKLRKDFEKVLPKGVYFVRTKQLGSEGYTREASDATSKHRTSKKDSVVFVFRVAKASVLDELWKMYQDKSLDKKIKQVLLSSRNITWNLSLEILFQEKDYNAIKRILGGEEELETKTVSTEEPSNSSQVDSTQAGTATVVLSPKDVDNQSIPQASKPSLPSSAATSKFKSTKSIPRVYLDEGNYNLSRELKLRDYQKELAAPAFEGKNTIICAPTNSGKTFVAMEIAKRHLDASKDQCQDEACKNVARTKVIFVVDKQNLVLQQRARFEEYLTNYHISDISGNNSDVNPLYSLMMDNDVIVLTAQILVNALRENTVRVSDISLLVFDECHHTNKDHPYNQIMQGYVELKIKENAKDSLPQVIGLTASLGVGQSNTEEKAKQHILQMCANLDASNISTVRKNVEDLIKNVTGHVPVRRVIPVTHDVQNIFEIRINKVMQEIEAIVKQLRSNSGIPHVVPTTDRQCEAYRQWIELLQNDTEIIDNRAKFTCAEQLRKYHEALLINNTVRIDDAMNCLAEYFDKLDQSKFTDNCLELQELFNKTKKLIEDHIKVNGKPDNPQLKGLENLIIEFHAKNGEAEAKGILFTRTRDYTVALKGWIEENEELKKILRPEVLVGSGDGDIGLTQTQQEAVIKKFKNGDVNIIIATTVAEEGLDISDCSYVIRYGMLGNEISSVQSRGRIRAKDGNYVYMPDSRTRGVVHETRNEFREMLMDHALEEVQDMERSVFLDRINEIQNRNINEIQMKKDIEVLTKSSKVQEGDNVALHCKKCETFVCNTRDIRRYKNSNHLVVNPDIQNYMNKKKRKRPENHVGPFFEYKVHCKECDFDWGILLLTQGAGWPCLKIGSFWTVFNDGQEKRLFKKWKDVTFPIVDATVDQLFDARKRLTDAMNNR